MADVPTYSTLTKEFVEVIVTPRDSNADPTADVVKMAFMPGPAKPQVADWVTGSWRVGADSGKFYARGLIGPGAKVLTPGTYQVWVTFTDNPEVPAKPTGSIKIV